MPSYKIIPTETYRIDPETLQERVNSVLGPDSTRDPKRGIVPETFTENKDGICWIKYGCEETYNRPTWDGTEETTEVSKFPIIFLQNGYVAHGKASNTIETNIESTIQELIGSEISLNPVEFDENDLTEVIDQASALQEANVSPSDRDDPEYLTASDRGDLRNTSFWEDYDVDPFEKIRIAVPGRNVDVDIGFDAKGTIVLYGRNMEMAVQARALRYLVDEIVDQYVNHGNHQGTLGRFNS
jgi:hypothetical protein